jgi:hypothetical protein
MIFFVMYTANEQLYRKTGWVLILFISFFIFGRYFFSLMYHRYQNDPDAMKNALWLGLYDEDNVPHWQKGGSVYFRQQPQIFNWVVLLAMSILKTINTIYQDSDELEAFCIESIRVDYTKEFIFFQRMSSFVS